MQNVDNPLGPDKIPFTNDDGLIPLSNSFLCHAGRDGETIGPYECQGCTSSTPIAFFSLDKQSGYEPLEVSFDASNSLPCASSMNSYTWDFGDGLNAIGEKVNHTFSNGMKTVTLTVRNNLNQEATYSKTLNIYPQLVPNLVLYLNLDNNLNDWSGRNHYVEWPNSAYTQGIESNAAIFDGTQSGTGINVRHLDDLDGMTKLTLSLWAKKNNPSESNLVIQKHVTYTMTLETNGFSSYLMNTTSRFDISANTASNDANWHHYALTYDGSNVKLYFDGLEAASKPFSGKIATNPDRSIALGKDVWGTSFDGAIDEFRIYDTALDSTQIKQQYDNPGNTTTNQHKKGDINKDGFVNIIDLIILVEEFGSTQPNNDLNADNKVDLLDIMIIVKDWN